MKIYLIILSFFISTISCFAAPEIGEKAPEFSLPAHDGKTYSLADFKGSFVVLEWFNYGCPYVKKIYNRKYSMMQDLQQKWTGVKKGQTKVTWLSIISSAPGKQGYVDAGQAAELKQELGANMDAILLDPENEIVWHNKGLTLYELDRNQEAMRCFDKAIRLDPELDEAWFFKGTIFCDHQKFREAIKCYDEAIRLDPELDDTWHKKGMALYYLREFDEAIKCYDKTIMLNYDSPDSWHNKGMTFEQLGKYTEATSCFDRSIKLKEQR